MSSNKRYLIKDNCIEDLNSEVSIELKNKQKEDIRNICKKLNGGSGFNGFTPLFFGMSYIGENNG